MRRLSAVLVLAAAAVLVAAAPARAEVQAATNWYRIMNWNSKLYLTVAAPADVNGSPIVQRGLLAGSQSQAWTLTPGTVSGYSYLRNAATSSWKALGISGSSPSDGGKAIIWTYISGLADQQWHQGLLLPGLLARPLVNLNSGKCLAIPASSTAAGVQAVQWGCRTGLADQYWVLTSWS